jgi:hypothetical protein
MKTLRLAKNVKTVRKTEFNFCDIGKYKLEEIYTLLLAKKISPIFRKGLFFFIIYRSIGHSCS